MCETVSGCRCQRGCVYRSAIDEQKGRSRNCGRAGAGRCCHRQRACRFLGRVRSRQSSEAVVELGGSDPFIVLEDANLEKAIEWGAWSRLLNCGQGCASAKRFIVVDSLYDRYLDGIRKAIAARKIGDPMDKETTLAPLSSERPRALLPEPIARSVTAV